jgi:hypothetical protein
MVSPLNTCINPSEGKLIGGWVYKNGKICADEVSQRIEALIRSHLKKVASSPDGWSELYLDDNDGRYWELSYPESSIHGGGAPCLEAIGDFVAKERYLLPS